MWVVLGLQTKIRAHKYTKGGLAIVNPIKSAKDLNLPKVMPLV